ncbi:hypothetical protein VTO42DRAFT_7575 [Malbranchea cinnamomea]
MSTAAQAPPAAPPPLSHILETILYVRDLDVSSKFYKDVFSVDPIVEIPKVLTGFSIGNTTLLLFKIGATDQDRFSDRGMIPKHGPTPEMAAALLAAKHGEGEAQAQAPALRQHYCFSAGDPDAVDRWDAHLQHLGVKITARMNWEKGGKSIYFEDPDGHVGEVGSRGIWPHY